MEPASLTLGRYEIVGRIGCGGMAEIFLARAKGPAGFEKLAVVKRILPARSEDPSFVRMFLDEARLAAALDHPNICHAYEFGVQAGTYFLTLEYVHGENLQTLMAAARDGGSPAPLACALYLVSSVASALHFAHELSDASGQPMNIVHRDVSPSNVMVGYRGNVKLLDFGIAKASLGGAQTTAGTVKGKLNYLSPEQCRSQPLDRRSDIFSLGILLYELTTGTVLFDGADEVAIFNRIATEELHPPSTILADYPRELERIVMKALARRKEDRFATAQQLREAIEAFAVEERIALSETSVIPFLSSVCGDRMTRPPIDLVVEDARPTEQITTAVQDVLYVMRDGRLETVKGGAGARPRTRRWQRSAIATVAVIGAVTAIVTWWPSTSAAPAIEPPPLAEKASPPTLAPADAGDRAIERVTIRFEIEPPDAEIRHGDEVLSGHLLELPAGRASHAVRVEAAGFVSRRAEFVPDRDRTISVSLARKRASKERARPRPAREAPRRVDRLIDRSWE